MANRLYGLVRKKSNQAPLDTAATTPAVRSPVAAAATATSTRTRTDVVGARPSRKSASTPLTANGTSAAAVITADRFRVIHPVSTTP